MLPVLIGEDPILITDVLTWSGRFCSDGIFSPTAPV